jgi:hypothetical protein
MMVFITLSEIYGTESFKEQDFPTRLYNHYLYLEKEIYDWGKRRKLRGPNILILYIHSFLM